jgi:hypothetical protein
MRGLVRGDDQAGAVGDALGDQFVKVVGMLRGELAQREVVERERGGFGVGGDASGEGAVGVSAGEVGQELAGFRPAGSAGGPGFPDLGDKVLDGREGEVRAVAEDRVPRSGKADEASGFRR